MICKSSKERIYISIDSYYRNVEKKLIIHTSCSIKRMIKLFITELFIPIENDLRTTTYTHLCFATCL